MARRDIRQPGPQAPNALQGAGVGFSTGASRLDPSVPDIQSSDFSVMKDVVPALAQITEGVMGTARENAFKQGRADQAADMLAIGNTVDSAAALIDQASWLTRDSYAQGVKVQQFTEGQLETQQEIANQARKSAEAGEPIEVFTQKIKPTLAKLNSQIVNLGLTGKAKDAAHDQLLAYVAVSQKAYQSQREAVAEEQYTKASNQTASAGFALLTATTGSVDSAEAFRTNVNALFTVEEGFDPVKAPENVGKKTKAVLDGILANVNPISVADQERIAGYAAYLRSQDSINIPQEYRAKMLTSIGVKQEEIMQTNELSLSNGLRDLETTYNSTGSVDPDSLQSSAASIMRQVQLGQLKVQAGNTALDRLHRLGLKADKEMGDKALIKGADINTRRAFGIKDVDQTAQWQQDFTKQAAFQGMPEKAGTLVVKAGLQFKNYDAVTKGHQQLVGSYASALTRNPTEFASNPDGLAQRTFLEDKQLATDNIVNNDPVSSSFQYKAWQTALGADGAAAMDSVMADPQVQTIEEAMQRYPMALDKIKEQRSTGGLGNVKFNGASLESGMFGKMFGLKSTLGAELGKNADPELLAIKANQLQMLYNSNKADLITKYSISDDKSAMKAMLAEGLLTETKFGTAMMSNRTKLVLGSGSIPNQDSIDRVDTDIRTSMVNELGPGVEASPENILIEYRPSGATVKIYSNNTFKDDTLIAQKSIPMVDLQRMDRQTQEIETRVNKPVGVMTTYKPGGAVTTTPTYEDDGTFGSNSFKISALQRISADEGYFTAPAQVDPNDPRTVLVGHSVRVDLYEKMFGKEQKDAFVLAARDPSSAAYGKLYNDFLTEHFKQFPSVLKTSGLEVQGLFTDSFSAEVLASTYYHGITSAQVMAEAMGELKAGGELKDAVRKVQGTSAYQEAGGQRQREMIQALEELY